MSYHEEQEQLENLKSWWKEYGNRIVWVLIVIMLAFAAWNGWRYYQRKQTAEASVLYSTLENAVQAKDKARIARVASDMEKDFGHTAYAQMTALLAGRALYDAGDAALAKAQLQWAIDHATDDEYKQMARLHLAGILLDEKAYDAGLKVLDGKVSPAFEGLFADRRGDLLAAQNKAADARQAYRAALDKLGTDAGGMRQFVQFKLDALGA